MGICLDTDASAAPDTEAGNESWVHQIENRNVSSANFNGRTQPKRSVDMENFGKIKFDPPKVPVIFVLGGPGSGKVTHCDTFMQERRGVTHINMMDLLQQYALGNDMYDFSELSSKTVTEVLMLEMKMAPAAKAYLISGYPRSMRDVVEYSEKIQVVNGVILISWRQAILQKQIDYGAKLGHVVLSLAKMELENFFKNVVPVADYFDQSDMLIAVNGERAPYEVYKDFRSAVLDILSALENQEAMLNGVTGMGKGIHDIPGSIVSVDTAPSQPPPDIAETTYNNTNRNNHTSTATTNSPTENTINNDNDNNKYNQYLVGESDEHNKQSLQEEPVITRQPAFNSFAPSMDAKSNRIPPIIWVIGGPGSNKATLCLKAVGINSGWGHISVGRILRAITDSAPRANTENYAIKEALGAGELAPERSVNNLLEMNIRQLSDKEGIVIDGYPRDLQQVKYFENKYKQLPPIILLDCSKLQLGRGRIDDSVSSFRRRLEVFRELTLPMLKTMDNSKRLQIVDGDTDSPSVQREFERILRSHIQRLAHGISNGSTQRLMVEAPSENQYTKDIDNMDAILHDLENNDSNAIKTISHHVSLMNGHLKNWNNSGSNNFNNRVQPYDNNKPMMNGDITGGNVNFRNMLQEAERYPVDSYI